MEAMKFLQISNKQETFPSAKFFLRTLKKKKIVVFMQIICIIYICGYA